MSQGVWLEACSVWVLKILSNHRVFFKGSTFWPQTELIGDETKQPILVYYGPQVGITCKLGALQDT